MNKFLDLEPLSKIKNNKELNPSNKRMNRSVDSSKSSRK